MEELTITEAVINSFNDENSPVVLVIFDIVRLEFIKVSKSCKKILGYDQNEMEGKEISNFLIPEDLVRSVEKGTKNMIAGEVVKGFQNKYICKDKKSARLMTWFNGSQNNKKVFAFALPGELIKLENEPKQ
jgi:PAS domain S-box-containing protein